MLCTLYIYENVVNFDDDGIFFRFVTKNFEMIMNQDEFLEVPTHVLAELFKSDKLRVSEVDLFKALCRWGKFQFQYNKQHEKEEDEIPNPIPISGEKLRESLGPLLSLIRFPLFSARDFVSQVPEGLLTLEESHSTLVYMARNDEERKEMLLKTRFPFVVQGRKSTSMSNQMVSWALDSTIDLFICENNSKIDVDIVSESHALKIHSFGFHGPEQQDQDQDNSEYHVTVICKLMGQKEPEYATKTYRKTILAQKNEIFHCHLVPPLLIQPNDLESRNRFSIYFKGGSLPSSIMPEKKTQDGVEFYYNYGKFGPLAEIEYELIKTDESTLSSAI